MNRCSILFNYVRIAIFPTIEEFDFTEIMPIVIHSSVTKFLYLFNGAVDRCLELLQTTFNGNFNLTNNYFITEHYNRRSISVKV